VVTRTRHIGREGCSVIEAVRNPVVAQAGAELLPDDEQIPALVVAPRPRILNLDANVDARAAFAPFIDGEPFWSAV
jgi:hypothetical protein